MDNSVVTTKIRVLTPSDGMALTDGTTYTTGSVFLAYGADASKWHEIPESEIPPTPEQTPVRTFRRSYIAQWIRANGKWDIFEAFLDLQPDFKFLWDYSTEFDDDNQMWPAAIAGVQQALELSDQEVSQLLDYGENGV